MIATLSLLGLCTWCTPQADAYTFRQEHLNPMERLQENAEEYKRRQLEQEQYLRDHPQVPAPPFGRR